MNTNMTRTSRWRLRHPVLPALAFAVAGLLAWPAAAQQEVTEFASWRVPGWSFTPGLAIGVVRDTNPGLAATGDTAKPLADSLFGIEPFGSLEFYSSRTEFSGGYRGYLRRYMEVDELNGFDQNAEVQLRHMATKRLTLFLRDHYLDVPTTDQVLLNGLPFLRTGSRTNALTGGLEARLTKFTDLNSRYEMTWVDFDNDETALTGGWVNEVRTDVMHRFTPRASAGAEYSVRFADLNDGTRSLTFQDAGGLFNYSLGPHTSFSAAGGLSYLADDLLNETRTAPYFRLGLTHQIDTVTIGTNYERSFVPSFGFGGSNESQELRGFVHMPIPSNRAYVQANVSWRRSVPWLATDLELDTILARSTIGYALARWFRVEGSHTFSRQDSTVTGGEVNRHRFGVQVVVSQPVRIQ
jgi:hypothetical protein